jgi:DNA-binding MarR family transcriptional regulator
MSIQTLCWVLEHSDARLGKRLVLLSLANHAHPDGTNAFPGVATIAHETRMKRRNVQYALRELEASGVIKRTGDRRGTNVYRVVQGAQKTTGGRKTRHRTCRILRPNRQEPSMNRLSPLA